MLEDWRHAIFLLKLAAREHFKVKIKLTFEFLMQFLKTQVPSTHTTRHTTTKLATKCHLQSIVNERKHAMKYKRYYIRLPYFEWRTPISIIFDFVEATLQSKIFKLIFETVSIT